MCMLCARHMDCTCRAIGLWERGAADSAGAMVGGEGGGAYNRAFWGYHGG